MMLFAILKCIAKFKIASCCFNNIGEKPILQTLSDITHTACATAPQTFSGDDKTHNHNDILLNN